jgi:3-deoxy-manno-octulosonate cytidylyltransferase (CMP-KDO synthetase)
MVIEMTDKSQDKMAVAVIPARFSSVRLPGKPLVDLGGKPMIQRVYEQVKKAKQVKKIIVATDNKIIAEATAGFGGEVAMTPPDMPTGTDRIALVANSIDHTDIIVNVQGDEPLIPPQMIDEVISLLVNDPSAMVSTLVQKITSLDDINNPNIVKVVLDNDGYACYFSRAPIPFPRSGFGPETLKQHIWYGHVGIYAFRKNFLAQFHSWDQSKLEIIEKLEQLRIIEHGFKIKSAVTKYRSISVDTPEDLERVRTIIKKQEASKYE